MNNCETADTVFVAVLLSLTAIQLFFHWFFYARLAFYKATENKTASNSVLPVSVVIAARNEYYNLKRNLPAILEQDYPEFEVVVVNHASEDETKELLKEFSGRYKNIKTVNIEQDLNFFKGKKFPLSIGIKSARYETLLLTDADCRPSSKHWIKKMAGAYGNNTEVVLGYGPYKKEKNLLNLLIRYDAFQVAITYLSFALAGVPYMGVGRNLSYKKSLFIKNRGFISHYNISSGDDDLFIGQVAKKHNTTIEISKESAVYSEPKKSFLQWIKQKRRHMTTGKKYKPHIKLLLGLLNLSQWLFYVTVIIMLAFNIKTVPALSAFVVRFASQAVIFKFAGNKLQENHIFVYLLFLEPLFLFLTPIFTLQGIFGKNGQWR
jgi:cellulose synthase/poly-beta-1,6-N-acetylglucosamine synthase-like glycosyltransferase